MSTRHTSIGLRLRVVAAVVATMTALAARPVAAETCTQDAITAAINSAGERLRKMTAETQPDVQAKLVKLKERNGWSDADYEEKGYNLLEDERTAKLDAAASDLLARIDQLGAETPNAAPDCSKLPEIEAASLELQATIKTKSQYITSRLDALLDPSKVAAAAPSPAIAAPPITPPKAAAPPVAKGDLNKGDPSKADPKKVDPKWATQTTTVPPPAPPQAQPLPTPPPVAQLPPALGNSPAPPEREGYSIDEIVGASSGLFGKVSSNLARVLEHAFAKSGRPTGYILGKESGGAFIAGLRYGSGTLYMRTGEQMPIFWHGPSLGADIGAQGAATLFLIYKAHEAPDVFSNFTGIEGSAFVVGGVGITFMSNGQIDMAPIRSGLGLRIGANFGYVRFTRKPTWNPF